MVAGLLAGVPVVPVPPDAGPLERAHILRDSGAEMLLGELVPCPASHLLTPLLECLRASSMVSVFDIVH